MRIIGCLLLCVTSFSVLAEQADNSVYEGQVTQVYSGDIITVKSGDETIDIRLAGISSPDEQQSHGPQSIQTLKQLVDGKNIIFRDTGTDACGRVVGLVWIQGDNGLDLSSRLVQSGAAWVYRLYTNSTELVSLENQAREKKLGLWAIKDPVPMPPWEWAKLAKFSGKQVKDGCKVKADDYSS